MQMLRLIFVSSVALLAGQDTVLSPNGEFDLRSSGKTYRVDRHTKTIFAATSNGVLFLNIGDNNIVLTSADADGKNSRTRSDLASANAHIDNAIPRPDGTFWLVSSGPYHPYQTFGFPGLQSSALPAPSIKGRSSTDSAAYYNDLDLYDSAGKHLESVRLLSPAGGFDAPLAASGDQLVLLSAVKSQSQLLRFGTIVNQKFQESARVRLDSPIIGKLPILTVSGELVLIDRKNGTMMIVDPKTGGVSVKPSVQPHPVRAAVADPSGLFLLFDGRVSKTDFAGQVLATYQFQFGRTFEPVALDVIGNTMYLVDQAAHTERFLLR
jgi:hypothetical protein